MLSPGSSAFHRHDSAVVLAVPLLPGESVTTAGIRVKDGKAEVNIPAQQTELQWESTLEKSEKIDYAATETEQWIEVLKADVSPIWHVETSGIAMIHLNNDGQWLPEWHPWPGEKITLQITRPSSGGRTNLNHRQQPVKHQTGAAQPRSRIEHQPEKLARIAAHANPAGTRRAAKRRDQRTDPTDQAGRQKAHRTGQSRQAGSLNQLAGSDRHNQLS